MEAKVTREVIDIELQLNHAETKAFMNLFNIVVYEDVEDYISREEYILLDRVWDAMWEVLDKELGYEERNKYFKDGE